VPAPEIHPHREEAAPGDVRWYCVRSQVKREHVAAAHLVERAGVEVFAPRLRAVHGNRNGGVTHTLEALFPGYVFARFDYARQSRHVVSTAGVRGLVSFGGTPPPVPDPVVEGLRREVAGGASAAASPILREGAWVRVLAGCFRFLEGRMVQLDPRSDRVRVLLDLLGGEVHVTLPAHQVIPLDGTETRYPAGLLQATDADALLRRAG
jgi:transcriptional antiterminator RfaH